jgi:dTMP kinase
MEDTAVTPLVDDGYPGTVVRLFGSPAFFRLWVVQVISAAGDWIGFLALITLAQRIGTAEGLAVGSVLSARIIPGLFLGSVAGVVADRFDRRKLMIICNLGRAVVMCALPFVDSLLGLVLASFLLEVMTLTWSSAKEATVPNLVPPGYLPTANSLSLAAAYGTFPVAALLFAALARVSTVFEGSAWAETLRLGQEGLALYLYAGTLVVAAALIATIPIPARGGRPRLDRTTSGRIDLAGPFRELAAGWRHIWVNPIVRAVIVGLGTGLFGGAMLIPLGAGYVTEVLGAGPAGYSLCLVVLGVGVAAGVLGLNVVQSRLDLRRAFAASVTLAAGSLALATATPSLSVTLVGVALLGVCAGAVYVLGFTLIQLNVDDDLRGRVFASLQVVVRLTVFLSMLVGPVLAAGFGALSRSWFGGSVSLGRGELAVPGVRMALWFAVLVMLAAGGIVTRLLRDAEAEHRMEPA